MTKRKEGAVKGRPPIYDEELIHKLADLVAKGLPIAKACQLEDMPSTSRLYEILQEKPHLRTVLMRAREAQADSLVAMMWDEAIKADESNTKTAQLRINMLQWMLARMQPKMYSERVLAEVAKLPEPKAPDTAPVDTQYLTYEERETFKQLLLLAKSRKEGMIDGEGTETNDGTDGTDAGTDDQSGDPTG